MRIAMVIVLSGMAASAAEEPKFKLSTKREGDKIESSSVEGKTVFTVNSNNGIGEGSLERLGEQWPDSVVLRLRLTGLEQLDVKCGTASMKASVLAGRDTLLSFTKDGKAVEGVDAKHPLWTEIKKIGQDGKPVADVPLKKGGHFEVSLPKELLKDNPKSIELKWIDWYRR